MAVAAQSALPGDALYPLKRAIENAETGFSVSDEAKGSTILGNASGRLDEVDALDPRRATPTPTPVTADARHVHRPGHRGRPTCCSPTTRPPAPRARSTSCATSPSDSIETLAALEAFIPAGRRGRAARRRPGALRRSTPPPPTSCPLCDEPRHLETPGRSCSPAATPRLGRRAPAVAGGRARPAPRRQARTSGKGDKPAEQRQRRRAPADADDPLELPTRGADDRRRPGDGGGTGTAAEEPASRAATASSPTAVPSLGVPAVDQVVERRRARASTASLNGLDRRQVAARAECPSGRRTRRCISSE